MINFGNTFNGLLAKKAAIDLDTPPPCGTYLFSVAKSETPIPDYGKEPYLVISAVVEEGEHEGRRLNARFYWGDEGGYGFTKLVRFVEACGSKMSEQFKNEQLVGHKFVGTVAMKLNKSNGREYTELVRYAPVDDNAAPVATPAGAPKAAWDA